MAQTEGHFALQNMKLPRKKIFFHQFLLKLRDKEIHQMSFNFHERGTKVKISLSSKFCHYKCPSVWAIIVHHTNFQSSNKKILEMGGSTKYLLIFLSFFFVFLAISPISGDKHTEM